MDEYFEKLGDILFHPIRNKVVETCYCQLEVKLTYCQNLAAVDLYRYDEAWELEPTRALSRFVDSVGEAGAALLDLRKPADFDASHVPGAYNLPLHTAGASTPSPFSDASVLESQWKELEATFTTDRINAHDLSGKDVYIICYNGDTARVATSVLRARGIAASSVRGGYSALRTEVPHLQMSEPDKILLKQGLLGASGVRIQPLVASTIYHSNKVIVSP